jgi:hypothetical protein
MSDWSEQIKVIEMNRDNDKETRSFVCDNEQCAETWGRERRMKVGAWWKCWTGSAVSQGKASECKCEQFERRFGLLNGQEERKRGWES